MAEAHGLGGGIEPGGRTTELTLRSFGVPIGIRTTCPEVLDRIPPYLPPGWQPAATQRVQVCYSIEPEDYGRATRYRLCFGPESLGEPAGLEEILERLDSHLHLEVATRAPRRIFVHAGVVAWRGRAIVIPGRSFSGKTSLVQAMLWAGAEYYSDEYAVLDSRGRVHAYPRPLGLRRQDGHRLGRRTASELGAPTGSRPLPVGLIVVARYHPGAAWRPRRLSAGHALLALLDNTVPARLRPEAVLPVLRCAAAGATALRGRRGEADETARLLLDVCDWPAAVRSRGG